MVFNNKTGKPSGRATSFIKEKLNVDWVYHDNSLIDLAAIPFGVDLQQDDILMIPDSLLGRFDQVSEGDDVFFMGFPLGLTSHIKVSPVVRQGCVALKAEDKTLLIDGNVFPGNSGSPLFLKPSLVDPIKRVIGGMRPPFFLGIVSAHLTSPSQTTHPSIQARENAGLGRVFSTDLVIDLLSNSRFKKFAESLPKG